MRLSLKKDWIRFDVGLEGGKEKGRSQISF